MPEKRHPTNRRTVLSNIGMGVIGLSAATGVVAGEGTSPCETATRRYTDDDYQEDNSSQWGLEDWAVESGTVLDIYGPEPETNEYRENMWRYQCKVSSTSQAYRQDDEDDKLGTITKKDITFGVTEDDGEVELRFSDHENFYGGWEDAQEASDSDLEIGSEIVDVGVSLMTAALRWGTPKSIAASLAVSAVSSVFESTDYYAADNSAEVVFEWDYAKEVSGNLKFDVYLEPGQTTQVIADTMTYAYYDGYPPESGAPATYVESTTIRAPSTDPANCDY